MGALCDITKGQESIFLTLFFERVEQAPDGSSVTSSEVMERIKKPAAVKSEFCIIKDL